MIPYENGLLLNSATLNDHGILKTQLLFGVSSTSEEKFLNDSFSPQAHMNWIFTQTPFYKRSLQVHSKNRRQEVVHQNRSVSKIKKRRLKKQRRSPKIKNCIIKMFKKKRRRIKRNGAKIWSKYVIPFVLGLLVAKSLLIPIALKVLAFISTKGLMMGFFSTALASLLSLKGMFEHSHGYKERKDDTKTQVEIIQVPSKYEDHIYHDEHYPKGDYVPIVY